MNPRLSVRRKWIGGLWLVAITAVSWPFSGYCQKPPGQAFARIDTTQGLAHNSVYDILQDHRGFLWFATEDGLSRYDGLETVTFRHDPFDQKSLAENDINDITMDASGALWIGSWGAGLDRLDPDTLGITHFPHDPGVPDGLSDNRVQSLLADTRGALWIGTYRNGLNRFQLDTGDFDDFRKTPELPPSLLNAQVWGLTEDGDGGIWAATEEGLFRYDPSLGNFTRFTGNAAAERTRVVESAKDGGVWIGTEHGVFRVRGFLPTPRAGDTTWEIVPDTAGVTCTALLEDEKGRLWIGTKRLGVLMYDPKSQGIFQFEHQESDPTSLSHNDVRALLIDRSENLWVGTRGGGVNKLDLKPEKFPRFLSGQDKPFRQSVWAFETDAEDTLWVGTSRGLFRFFEGGSQSFVFDSNDEHSLSYQKVRALLVDDGGRLWIGTNGGGLNLFDPESGGFERFRHRPGDPSSLASDDVLVLARASNGDLWIGTDGGGLDSFDPERRQIRHVSFDPDDPSNPDDDTITAILEDSRGALWVGTSGGGLKLREKGQTVFRHFRHSDGDVAGLSSDNILCLHEAMDGALWIGTSAGLNLFNRMTGHFEVLGKRDGLPSNVIIRILEDDQGALWLTTNQGLARLNPSTRECRVYGIDDGLQSLGFNEGAAFLAEDGTMYVGGTSGFNSFDPSTVEDNPYVPEVVITGLRILNGKRIFDKALWALEEIQLQSSDTVFTFDFAALEFTAPQKNNFRYLMEGFDREWIRVGHRHHATYTNMDPGRYVFRVQAGNNDGLWSPEGASIRIKIAPAVWQTWWFRSLAGLTFLTALVIVFRVRTRAIVRRNQELETLVKRREEAESRVRRYAEELEHSTLHDRLTGLPNRALFLDRVQVVMDRSRRDRDLVFAVLVVDLDGFRLVNDSLGHEVGDQLLKAISRRAEASIRPEDSIARLGADEFAMLLYDIGDVTALMHLMERVHRTLDEPFIIGDHEIFTTVSIGIVVSSEASVTPADMLRDADTAVHRAKAAGRGTHVIFNPEMHVDAAVALDMEGALRRAVEHDQFILEYQPIIDISRGRLAGFEALIRWRRPGRPLAYPRDFLRYAWEAGLTRSIGDWVVRKACEQAAQWQASSSNGPVTVSVNLFSQQVSDGRLVDVVTSSLKDAALSPALLHLEITENVLIDAPDSAIDVLSTLRAQGLRVLLDDFGTGYSSLTYLQRFPIDGLKIDRSFVGNMTTRPDNAKIVESIVLLAQSLDKDIIAEGVESMETVVKLRDFGCRFSQGFFFGHSVSGDAATLLVEKAPTWPIADSGLVGKAGNDGKSTS